MGLSLNTGVSAAAVFLQGLLSFFSPCVLPLLPVYFGYLSGGGVAWTEEGEVRYDRGRVARNTVFFVVGIAFAFLLLGLGMTALGSFLGEYRRLFACVGGVIVILFGLYQLDVFGRWMALDRERRLPFQPEKTSASPWTALAMGFLFSFAWTPCVGPALSSVLLMTASASSRVTGLVLLGIYTLGFVLPFLAAGFFTTALLGLFRRHRNVVRYTAKIGGVVLILMGVLMLTGTVNRLSGSLAAVPPAEQTQQEETVDQPEEKPEETASPSPDFTLTDQFGQTHHLSDYKGKVVFLNFWATWCPPCRAEMPDIQKLYEKYRDGDEVVILGVAGPGTVDDRDTAGVAAFLKENGYTYPVVMDETGKVFERYGIRAYPTTFMIDRSGSVYGYVTGSMDQATMQDIIDQTLAAGQSGE